MLTLGATILLWIIALLTAARKKDFINAFQPFFSYGFWSFLFIYAGLNYILFGMKLHEWDEFSHWGTVVKAMVQTGSLGTSSQAHLSFGSYPPGMALFQYYLQRLCTLTKTDAFSEWHLYLAYIVAALSFLLPLIKRTGCRSLGSRTIITVIFLILPLPFIKIFITVCMLMHFWVYWRELDWQWQFLLSINGKDGIHYISCLSVQC